MARRRTFITYLVVYFFAIGTAIRYLITFREHSSLGTIISLLVAFILFITIEPWISRRSHRYTLFYLSVQSLIIITLSLTLPEVDYFGGLYFSLSLQAMHVFPPQIGFRWIGVFTMITAILLFNNLGWTTGLPLVIINAAGNFFIGSFVSLLRISEESRQEAETARAESHQLLSELQTAHKELQIFAEQVEEQAVVQERDRLARDLHDSVTQSLFSLTLFAEAARELAGEGKLELIIHNLDRMADTAGQALKEMRLLVFELRPLALAEVGLIGALQNRLDMVERRAGVKTRFILDPNSNLHLTAPIEEGLYRIAQEALNNTLKHAHATSVIVRIANSPDYSHLELEIIDDGCGFDPELVGDKGGLGLQSIRERVETMDGKLTIRSAPGQGTSVKVGLEMKP